MLFLLHHGASIRAISFLSEEFMLCDFPGDFIQNKLKEIGGIVFRSKYIYHRACCQHQEYFYFSRIISGQRQRFMLLLFFDKSGNTHISSILLKSRKTAKTCCVSVFETLTESLAVKAQQNFGLQSWGKLCLICSFCRCLSQCRLFKSDLLRKF